jgi:polyketide synthase Type III
LRIVLSKDIRNVAGKLAKQTIAELLRENNLAQDDIAHWVIHSGGRRVIDNIKAEVGLTEDQLRHSRAVLKSYGNMSSPTVLFVLSETMRNAHPHTGEYGVMLAMGPGLAIEAALLEW